MLSLLRGCCTLRVDSKVTSAFWRAVATAAGVRLHRRISNMPASPSFAALSSPRQNTQFIFEPTLSGAYRSSFALYLNLERSHPRHLGHCHYRSGRFPATCPPFHRSADEMVAAPSPVARPDSIPLEGRRLPHRPDVYCSMMRTAWLDPISRHEYQWLSSCPNS
jgi:hypothetical protein